MGDLVCHFTLFVQDVAAALQEESTAHGRLFWLSAAMRSHIRSIGFDVLIGRGMGRGLVLARAVGSIELVR